MTDKLQEARDALENIRALHRPNVNLSLNKSLEAIQTALNEYEKQLAGDNGWMPIEKAEKGDCLVYHKAFGVKQAYVQGVINGEVAVRHGGMCGSFMDTSDLTLWQPIHPPKENDHE